MTNCYKTAVLHIIRSAEKTAKLDAPLNSSALSMPINSVDEERSFNSCIEPLHQWNDAPDANSQQPPSVLIKARLELEKYTYQCSCGISSISKASLAKFKIFHRRKLGSLRMAFAKNRKNYFWDYIKWKVLLCPFYGAVLVNSIADGFQFFPCIG